MNQREIKFRGIGERHYKWVYGSLLQSEIDINEIAVECFICERFAHEAELNKIKVIPNTVGQYTGLKDKTGKEIYEGDVLKKSAGLPVSSKPHKFKPMIGSIKKVIFEEGAFKITKSNASLNYCLSSFLIRLYGLEIIGNIYEHSHILKQIQK